MREISRCRRGAAIELTFEDGSKQWYFSHNLVAYKRALESGTFPLDRTSLMPPPPPPTR